VNQDYFLPSKVIQLCYIKKAIDAVVQQEWKDVYVCFDVLLRISLALILFTANTRIYLIAKLIKVHNYLHGYP
jgi:hypothetical protein